MPIVKEPQSFDGRTNHAASGPIALKTSFGGSNEPYPLALLEDSASDATHSIRNSASDSTLHNGTTHLIVENHAVPNHSDTQDTDAYDSGCYRVITDDLIDPVLLAWEEDQKIALFDRRIATFKHTAGHSDSDIDFKTSVNFMLNAIANSPITGHHAPTTCNFPNPAITFLASNHNLTGDHSLGTFSPNVVHPIFGASSTTRPGCIQPASNHHIAKPAAFKLQTTPPTECTTKKCRECKVGTA